MIVASLLPVGGCGGPNGTVVRVVPCAAALFVERISSFVGFGSAVKRVAGYTPYDGRKGRPSRCCLLLFQSAGWYHLLKSGSATYQDTRCRLRHDKHLMAQSPCLRCRAVDTRQPGCVS